MYNIRNGNPHHQKEVETKSGGGVHRTLPTSQGRAPVGYGLGSARVLQFSIFMILVLVSCHVQHCFSRTKRTFMNNYFIDAAVECISYRQ